MQALLDSEGLDVDVDGLELASDLLGNLHAEGDLVGFLELQAHVQGEGEVHGHVNAGADELGGEGRDDSKVGLELDVDDGHELGLQLSRDELVLLLLGLGGALDGDNDGDAPLDVDRETSIARAETLDVDGLEGGGVVEVLLLVQELGVGLDLFGELLDAPEDLVLVEVHVILKVKHTLLEEELGGLGLPGLDPELLGDHPETVGNLKYTTRILQL